MTTQTNMTTPLDLTTAPKVTTPSDLTTAPKVTTPSKNIRGQKMTQDNIVTTQQCVEKFKSLAAGAKSAGKSLKHVLKFLKKKPEQSDKCRTTICSALIQTAGLSNLCSEISQLLSQYKEEPVPDAPKKRKREMTNEETRYMTNEELLDNYEAWDAGFPNRPTVTVEKPTEELTEPAPKQPKIMTYRPEEKALQARVTAAPFEILKDSDDDSEGSTVPLAEIRARRREKKRMEIVNVLLTDKTLFPPKFKCEAAAVFPPKFKPMPCRALDFDTHETREEKAACQVCSCVENPQDPHNRCEVLAVMTGRHVCNCALPEVYNKIPVTSPVKQEDRRKYVEIIHLDCEDPDCNHRPPIDRLEDFENHCCVDCCEAITTSNGVCHDNCRCECNDSDSE